MKIAGQLKERRLSPAQINEKRPHITHSRSQETLLTTHAQKDSLEIKRGSDAAAAKLLQSCLTLCDPIDGSSPGSTILGILQARTLEWVAISFSNA